MVRGRAGRIRRFWRVAGLGTLAGVPVAVLLAAGCGDDDAMPGGGAPDGASPDGSAPNEAGGGDATPIADAGVDADADAEPVDAGPDVLEVANVAFATSFSMNAAFGGLDGGDEICNAEAADAGLTGTYVAYLSTSTVDAIDRIAGSRGWVRPDGRPFVDRPEDLAEGRIVYPLTRTARNEAVHPFDEHFSGSNPEGRKDAYGWTCGDWTLTTGSAALGQLGTPTKAFSGTAGTQCASTRRLACMGVGKTYTLPPPPKTMGRLAFVSTGSFTPGGGLTAADALCQTEADAAGRSGTFRALLAVDGATAASRFSTAGLPWVRPDGLPLADTAEAFLTQRTYELPILFSADGLTQFDVSKDYWKGALDPSTPGTAESTCASWTTTTGDAAIGGWGVDRAGWGTVNGVACSTPLALVCLQE